MEQRECGTPCTWPVPQMVNSRRAERALERIGLEPFVQPVGDRHRQDAQEIGDPFVSEAAEAQAESHITKLCADAATRGIRRRRHIECLQQAGEACHARAERRPPIRVVWAYPPDRFRRLHDVLRQLEPAAVGEGHGEPGISLRDRKPRAVEPELVRDLGGYPPFVVVQVVRVEHHHIAAGTRQGMCGDELVCAGTQNDRAGHDRVRAHASSRRIARAALRPDAPITPPPGCVPAPH